LSSVSKWQLSRVIINFMKKMMNRFVTYFKKTRLCDLFYGNYDVVRTYNASISFGKWNPWIFLQVLWMRKGNEKNLFRETNISIQLDQVTRYFDVQFKEDFFSQPLYFKKIEGFFYFPLTNKKFFSLLLNSSICGFQKWFSSWNILENLTMKSIIFWST